MPSNSALISGPAVGAAQVLIWSYSCVFLPPMSTAIKASVFLCGSSQWPFIYSIDTVCLVDHVDLTCSWYGWWEGFGSSSLATLPLGFNCGFSSTSAHGGLLGFSFSGCPGGLGFGPVRSQVWRWCSCLGHRGSGSTRYSGELVAQAAGNIML